jgi:peptidoglycan/LPS O-acetylase OafA/YrhL
MPVTSSRHVPALDGVRGLAILWVVLHNTLGDMFAPTAGALHDLAFLARPGWIGVQLFFALSGFLITAGLLDTRGASNYFRGFYVRRALRILPLYYAVLLLLLVFFPRLVLPASQLQTSVGHQASLWFFAINWTHAPVYGFIHFWSLAVEEQFYLLWPLLVYRLEPRRLLPVCLWIAFGAFVCRCVMVARGVDPWTVYTATTSRMDALALGAAGACILRMPSLLAGIDRHLRGIGAVFLVLFLLGIPLTHSYDYDGIACETFGYTLLAACSAVLVTAAAMADDRRSWPMAVLSWAPLRSCGKYSYGIYVFHELLHILVSNPWLVAHFGRKPPPDLVLAMSSATFIVSFVLAFASYHAFEKHFLGLKRLVRPKTAVSVAV